MEARGTTKVAVAVLDGRPLAIVAVEAKLDIPLLLDHPERRVEWLRRSAPQGQRHHPARTPVTAFSGLPSFVTERLPWLSGYGDTLVGDVQLDAELTGTLDAPTFDGRVEAWGLRQATIVQPPPVKSGRLGLAGAPGAAATEGAPGTPGGPPPRPPARPWRPCWARGACSSTSTPTVTYDGREAKVSAEAPPPAPRPRGRERLRPAGAAGHRHLGGPGAPERRPPGRPRPGAARRRSRTSRTATSAGHSLRHARRDGRASAASPARPGRPALLDDLGIGRDRGLRARRRSRSTSPTSQPAVEGGGERSASSSRWRLSRQGRRQARGQRPSAEVSWEHGGLVPGPLGPGSRLPSSR